MSDRFIPLATYLRPNVTPVKRNGLPEAQRPSQAQPIEEPTAVIAEEAETIAAARRFRAALADAIDAAVARMLDAIGRDVVARELQISPAEIASVVKIAMERCALENAVAIRVHPDDYEALAEWNGMRTSDGSLRRGDALIELHSGTIDLRLKTRLEAALDACLP
jgi:flagellar biosynthesis/type III secretory pathway protein FliH